MWAILAKQWFLVALAICFATGYAASDALAPVLQWTLFRQMLVFAVMWLMGVTLKAGAIRKSVAQPWPSLLAITLNVVGVPLLCLPMMWVLPTSLFGGLFVASIVPCTLASASVWTRKAGGDDSVSMVTTVVTNLACVVVVPVGLSLVLSTSAEAGGWSQVQKLALVVVCPLGLAQLVRVGGLSGWADRYKSRISVLAQVGILAMVMIGSVASGQAMSATDSPASVVGQGGEEVNEGLLVERLPANTTFRPSALELGLTLAAAMGIHVLALGMGIGLAARTGCHRDRQIAVGIAGSQKTLMVGLQIAIDCGVSVMPMLIYHLGQLVIDTLICQRWKSPAKPLPVPPETTSS